MKTIRRLYIYLITLISLEVVTWGMIRLARTFTNPAIGRDAGSLAGALALILVGLPIFMLHWWMAQRQASAEEEERFCLIRALFFYGAFLGALIPVTQNILVLINRLFLSVFQQPSYLGIFGGRQIWSDNLIAIFMNILIGAYIFYTLRKDWDAEPPNSHLVNIRRLSRYLLLVYSLGLVVGGVSQVIRFLFKIVTIIGKLPQDWLANGLSLLVVGVPFWLVIQRIIQRSLQYRTERTALLRQIILILLGLLSAVGILFPLGLVVNTILWFVFGESMTMGVFLADIAEPLAIALPLGGVWFYYSRSLRRTFDSEEYPQRGELFRKLYYYILAALGLIATFVGLQKLFAFLIDLTMRTTALWGNLLRERLTASLASLMVGIPLWILTWRLMVTDAAQEGEAGDRSRRSLVRKTYLYLALFVGVIGAMVSAGYVIFLLFKALFGQAEPDLLAEVLTPLSSLILFGSLLLGYHLSLLRSDNKRAQRFLEGIHAQFPVLVLTTKDGKFAPQVAVAFQREMPSLPIAIHSIEIGVPNENLSQAQAVILPGNIAAEPPEAIRVWLKNFSGPRLVVPAEAENWHWVFGSGRPSSMLVNRLLKIIREMAEGDEISLPRERSPFQNVLSVFGVLFGIQLLFGLVVFIINLTMN